MTRLPTLAGIEDALNLLRPHLAETPLVRSELLSRAMDAEIWIKNETVSPIASFKMRGAITDICRARRRERSCAWSRPRAAIMARGSRLRRSF